MMKKAIQNNDTTSNALAAAAMWRRLDSVFGMDTVSTIERTASAAVLDHAKAPRREMQSLRDPTMILPT